jgi:hypothetical protein
VHVIIEHCNERAAAVPPQKVSGDVRKEFPRSAVLDVETVH